MNKFIAGGGAIVTFVAVFSELYSLENKVSDIKANSDKIVSILGNTQAVKHNQIEESRNDLKELHNGFAQFFK